MVTCAYTPTSRLIPKVCTLRSSLLNGVRAVDFNNHRNIRTEDNQSSDTTMGKMSIDRTLLNINCSMCPKSRQINEVNITLSDIPRIIMQNLIKFRISSRSQITFFHHVDCWIRPNVGYEYRRTDQLLKAANGLARYSRKFKGILLQWFTQLCADIGTDSSSRWPSKSQAYSTSNSRTFEVESIPRFEPREHGDFISRISTELVNIFPELLDPATNRPIWVQDTDFIHAITLHVVLYNRCAINFKIIPKGGGVNWA